MRHIIDSGLSPIDFDPEMNKPQPVCDFFYDHDGVEYVVEIYDVGNGCVEDFGMYPLNEDGSKAPPVDPERFDGIWETAQQQYWDWIDSMDE